MLTVLVTPAASQQEVPDPLASPLVSKAFVAVDSRRARSVGWVWQVTDLKGYTIELRALTTARDAPAAWDLRCHIREKLIEFIQQNYPASLPQLRTRSAEDKERSEERTEPPFVMQPHEQGLA